MAAFVPSPSTPEQLAASLPPRGIAPCFGHDPALAFGDGHVYRFRDPALLVLAFNLKRDKVPQRAAEPHNQELALRGDDFLKSTSLVNHDRLTRDLWNNQYWTTYHCQGVGYGRYQAWRGDVAGLTGYARFVAPSVWQSAWGQVTASDPITPHEKSTIVEAVVGAVRCDSRGDGDVEVDRLVRFLGLEYPSTDAEAGNMDALLQAYGTVQQHYQ